MECNRLIIIVHYILLLCCYVNTNNFNIRKMKAKLKLFIMFFVDIHFIMCHDDKKIHSYRAEKNFRGTT